MASSLREIVVIRGVDISSVQDSTTTPDWKRLYAQGIRFAIIKCTTGNEGKDPGFDNHVAQAKAAGVVVGPYHFSFPLPTDAAHPGRTPEEQADAFWAASGSLGSNDGELPPAIDLEWPVQNDWAKWGVTPDFMRGHSLALIEAVAQRWGCRPLVYTYYDWFTAIGGMHEPAFAANPLWMASYANGPAFWPVDGAKPPIVVKPWTAATVWQFSGGGIILPGVGKVDTDVIADDATLQKLCTADLTAVW